MWWARTVLAMSARSSELSCARSWRGVRMICVRGGRRRLLCAEAAARSHLVSSTVGYNARVGLGRRIRRMFSRVGRKQLGRCGAWPLLPQMLALGAWLPVMPTVRTGGVSGGACSPLRGWRCHLGLLHTAFRMVCGGQCWVLLWGRGASSMARDESTMAARYLPSFTRVADRLSRMAKLS